MRIGAVRTLKITILDQCHRSIFQTQRMIASANGYREAHFGKGSPVPRRGSGARLGSGARPAGVNFGPSCTASILPSMAISKAPVSLVQVSPAPVSPSQVRPAQVGPDQLGPAQRQFAYFCGDAVT